MTPTGETIVIDPMIKELMESAAIGEAAKMFLQSELGGSIARRAAEEVEAATARLIEADPTDISLIARLQTEIKVAKQGITWLVDAMTSGDHAMKQLQQLDEE